MAGPVPANVTFPMHSTDSYRSEVAGLLAGMYLLHQLEEITGKSTRVTLSCNNDAALRVSTEYTFFKARMKHYDITRSLILMIPYYIYNYR